MDHAALAARHAAAVTRYARQLDDEGRVPPGLLADLARIADEHAADAAIATAAATAPAEPPGAESPPPAPARPPAARTAPRRRTRTRTT